MDASSLCIASNTYFVIIITNILEVFTTHKGARIPSSTRIAAGVVTNQRVLKMKPLENQRLAMKLMVANQTDTTLCTVLTFLP